MDEATACEDLKTYNPMSEEVKIQRLSDLHCRNRNKTAVPNIHKVIEAWIDKDGDGTVSSLPMRGVPRAKSKSVKKIPILPSSVPTRPVRRLVPVQLG